MILASEAGTYHIDPANIASTGKLQPGRMFILDLQQGRIIGDDEIKGDIVTRHPYRKWIDLVWAVRQQKGKLGGLDAAVLFLDEWRKLYAKRMGQGA